MATLQVNNLITVVALALAILAFSGVFETHTHTLEPTKVCAPCGGPEGKATLEPIPPVTAPPPPVPAPCPPQQQQQPGKFVDPLEPKRKAVILAISRDDKYSFFAPITSLIWQRLGYGSYYMVYYTEAARKSSQRYAVIEKWLKKVDDVELAYYQPYDHEGEGFVTGAVEMLARYYIGAAIKNRTESDYYLMSDVDMWPLSKWYFSSQNWKQDVHILYANHFLPRLVFASCYIGMSLKNWREVMKVSAADDHRAVSLQRFSAAIPKTGTWDQQWNYDQIHFGESVSKSRFWPARVQLSWRPEWGGVPSDRLDRGRWDDNANLNGENYVDAHLLRPGFADGTWQRLRRVLEQLVKIEILTPDDVKWCEAYRNEYIAVPG